MFNAYEFTFGGESSLMYGLMLYNLGGKGQSDVAFANRASIVETRTNDRIRPIHFGVNYHSKPLEFRLVFGADHALDRYELENISMWLLGHQSYQWLTIDQPDMERVQFRCLITQLTPLSHGWLPVAFEATVLCDCPYAYGFPFERRYTLDGTTNILIRNDSSVREFIKPVITFLPNSTRSGANSLTIINHNDGDRMFKLDDLPSSNICVVVDNSNGVIRETNFGHNLYHGFNLNFFRLVHGDNNIEVVGNGLLTISGRLLHNVAG